MLIPADFLNLEPALYKLETLWSTSIDSVIMILTVKIF